ncbi:MAG: hypothetical protein WBF05_09025 [Anaerolineales bacterium]
MEDNSSKALIPVEKSHRKLSQGKYRPRTSLFGGLRSLSRLMIGSVGLGIDEFQRHLSSWDEEYQLSQIQNESSNYHPSSIENNDKVTVIPYEEIDNDQLSNDFRFTIIGLLFETQDKLQSRLQTVSRAGRLINDVTTPIVRPFTRSWLIPPLRRRYDALVDRGEEELNRWTSLGRSEYIRSRAMAQTAIESTYQETVDTLANDPEIQELIQTQGIGLAVEVVDELRERSVSADTFLDGFVRALLRRTPRAELPLPPEDVQKSAVHVRQPMSETDK